MSNSESLPTLRASWRCRDRQFECGARRLVAREWQREGASDEGSVLVLLHGWMDNAGSFDLLIPLLSPRTAYALDFSGHGLSAARSAGDDYYIWSFVDEVLALLDKFSLSSCVLIGHSMGGAVATLVAGMYPEKIEQLVLLDAAGPLTLAEDALPARMRDVLDKKRRSPEAALARHYPQRADAIASRARRGISLGAAAQLAGRGLAQDEAGWFWTVDRRLLGRTPLSLSVAQVEAFLRCIEAPVLLLLAEDSEVKKRLATPERQALFQRLHCETLPGNHFLHLEEDTVQEVASQIRSFLLRSA